MTVRIIPLGFDSTVALSATCRTALAALEVVLNIKQNNLAALTADHNDFIGSLGNEPAAIATGGKQDALNEARKAVLSARIPRRAAVEAGRVFNGRAVDYLKGFLGRTWNPQWVVLGLTSGS